eukprot:COSAG03_NODE_3823_length_1811_cov_66.319323_1_plen_148_part_00
MQLADQPGHSQEQGHRTRRKRRERDRRRQKDDKTHLAGVAAVPGRAAAPVDLRRRALPHRALHSFKHLLASAVSLPLLLQGLAAVEVVRHQHGRAASVAARRLAAAAVLRRLVATRARYGVCALGQVRRLAGRTVSPLGAAPAVQAR